jgi:hypothetical protein
VHPIHADEGIRMHRFRPRLTYANVMSTLAVFVTLGGGAYAAVSSIPGRDGVIHGCYHKGRGNLRLVPAHKKCAKSEKAIAFNQKGPQGLPGARGVRGFQGFRGIAGSPGAPGAAGAKGEQGPTGPGASTFTTTLAKESEPLTLVTLANGVTVKGQCGASAVVLEIETTSHASNLQASGTKSVDGATVVPLAVEGAAAVPPVSGPSEANVDVLARDSTVGRFARIDVHGSLGSPCTFWGMIIPSG